jgi:ribosomal protein L15
VINVDTLSAAFAAGEEVDINRLKKKKLIAQDVGYLKVLARGSINKPLTVYADDFSLGAIKMIALTGGRTFHVKTKRLP